MSPQDISGKDGALPCGPGSQAAPEAAEASSPSVSIPNADAFRAELMKIMPGYKWTVHRASKGAVRLFATGIQSSGFNRLSTLCVERKAEAHGPWYTVKSAGFGTRTPFNAEIGDVTLARALRGLQDHYERKSNSYDKLARDLKNGRAALSLAHGEQP